MTRRELEKQMSEKALSQIDLFLRPQDKRATYCVLSAGKIKSGCTDRVFCPIDAKLYAYLYWISPGNADKVLFDDDAHERIPFMREGRLV